MVGLTLLRVLAQIPPLLPHQAPAHQPQEEHPISLCTQGQRWAPNTWNSCSLCAHSLAPLAGHTSPPYHTHKHRSTVKVFLPVKSARFPNLTSNRQQNSVPKKGGLEHCWQTCFKIKPLNIVWSSSLRNLHGLQQSQLDTARICGH